MNDKVQEVVEFCLNNWKKTHSARPEALWGGIAFQLGLSVDQVRFAEWTALGSTDYVERFSRNLVSRMEEGRK